MNDSNFSARQRVAHKLTGAAYQMTFVEEYDLAMQTAARAIEFWEETREEPLSDDEAADIYGRATPSRDLPQAVTDGMGEFEIEPPSAALSERQLDSRAPSEISIPSPGTQSREVVSALLEANRDGIDWANWSDLKGYCSSKTALHQIAAMAKNKDYINWKKQDGGKSHLYRIAPEDRDAVERALEQQS